MQLEFTQIYLSCSQFFNVMRNKTVPQNAVSYTKKGETTLFYCSTTILNFLFV